MPIGQIGVRILLLLGKLETSEERSSSLAILPIEVASGRTDYTTIPIRTTLS